MKKLFAVLFLILFVSPNVQAAPSNEIQEAQLEKLIAEQDACRLVVSAYKEGMTKLYFANKAEAEAAVKRLRSQAYKRNSQEPGREFMPYVTIFSPDCDIDVLDYERGN